MTTDEQLKNIHPKLISLITACLYPPKDVPATIGIIANIIMNDIQSKIDNDGISWGEMDDYHPDFNILLADCALAQSAGVLENRHVKKIINDCWNYPYVGYDLIQYCRETKILEEAGGDVLLELVKQALLDNPKAAEELKQGKEKAIGALVGSVMKKQKANPAEIQKLIKSELGLVS